MYTISVIVKPYIRDFLLACYGPEPISFIRDSDESMCLLDLLNKPPAGKINKGNIEIKLQVNDFKRPEVYNYLSESSHAVFVSFLADSFWRSFRSEMYAAERVYPGAAYNDFINMFMEKYSIDPTHFETLKKHFYRYRKRKRKTKIFFRFIA